MLIAAMATLFGFGQEQDRFPRVQQLKPAPEMSRGGDSKLSAELAAILDQVTGSRGPGIIAPTFSREVLESSYGIEPGSRNPVVTLTIELKDGESETFLRTAGMTIQGRIGNFVTGSAPIRIVERIGVSDRIVQITINERNPVAGGVAAAVSAVPGAMGGRAMLPNAVSQQGKGVIIAVIDTGIDVYHPDFRDAAGNSRILAYFDPFDESNKTSGGKVGSPSPIAGIPGTLYTQEQITAAIKAGSGVNSVDEYGHGTAVASVAAGNGLGAGANAALFRGVAPEAMIIAIKKDNGKTEYKMPILCKWIQEFAKAKGMPVVINYSAGSNKGPHDGTTDNEKQIDLLFGPGKKGTALTVSAGNERLDLHHAGGRFTGANKVGSIINASLIRAISFPIGSASTTMMQGYFRTVDDWTIAIKGTAAPFDKGFIHIGESKSEVVASFPEAVSIEQQAAFFKLATVKGLSNGDTELTLHLPAGTYEIFTYGNGEKIEDGRYSLYLPSTDEASFYTGAVQQYMVITPASAKHAIAVGAYNMTDAWTNNAGEKIDANLEVGDIADFSCPGFRRDGVVKPDLTAPGCWLLSAAAKGSGMQAGAVDSAIRNIGPNNIYLAWKGTSASAPYLAGVIALMLEKNPNLDSDEIRDILRRSASTDKFTGGVPNPTWGYGKVDAKRALEMTPAK